MPKFPSSFQTACEVLSRNSWFLHVQTSLILLGHTKVFQLWRNILCVLGAASVFSTLDILHISWLPQLTLTSVALKKIAALVVRQHFLSGWQTYTFNPWYSLDLKYNNNNEIIYFSAIHMLLIYSFTVLVYFNKLNILAGWASDIFFFST